MVYLSLESPIKSSNDDGFPSIGHRLTELHDVWELGEAQKQRQGEEGAAFHSGPSSTGPGSTIGHWENQISCETDSSPTVPRLQGPGEALDSTGTAQQQTAPRYFFPPRPEDSDLLLTGCSGGAGPRRAPQGLPWPCTYKLPLVNADDRGAQRLLVHVPEETGWQGLHGAPAEGRGGETREPGSAAGPQRGSCPGTHLSCVETPAAP